MESNNNKKTYRARAPLRLGLGGGGTDITPFCEEYGSYVINATIDLYAHAILEETNNNKITINAVDLDIHIILESKPMLNINNEPKLHLGVYNKIIKTFNNNKELSFNLTTYADAPVGSGLGTSSTMVVCLIKVFSEWLNLSLGDYEIAKLAFEIEREDLNLKGGRQDQYAASFGGFNYIEFGPGKDRVIVNPLRIKNWIINELETSILLFYTGYSRESSQIIDEQIRNSESLNDITMELMFSIKNDSTITKNMLLKGDLTGFANKLNESWIYKKNLSSKVSNNTLNNIYDNVINSGATSGKLSGAGGGGFFMFFVEPKHRYAVILTLSKFKGQIINFHFVDHGVHSWTLYG